MEAEARSPTPWLQLAREAAATLVGDHHGEGRTIRSVHRESQLERTAEFEALKAAAIRGTKRKPHPAESFRVLNDAEVRARRIDSK